LDRTYRKALPSGANNSAELEACRVACHLKLECNCFECHRNSIAKAFACRQFHFDEFRNKHRKVLD
jgi:hypothetical protein